MNFYILQKINKYIKLERIKNMGLWLLHIINKPYLAVYFDPILSCNLRCKSCYFSIEEERIKLKGSFQKDDIPIIAQSVFSRTLRLQIGCGAEPSLFRHNEVLIKEAKKYGIKYVSMTSNANLLTKEMIFSYLEAGLDELTISIHGVNKGTYETLMVNASYEKLLTVLQILTDLKRDFPKFKLRLNFTINNLNINELSDFFEVYGKYNFDILQLRALRNIGGEITNVDVNEEFVQKLEEVLSKIKKECKTRMIHYIEPEKFVVSTKSTKNIEIQSFSYAYISPNYFIEEDYNWRTETFNEYSRRTKYWLKLFLKLVK